MGSPSLLTRQRALKIGYFYWLRVKNSNHFDTELRLGYWKDTKFYLTWLREYCTFSYSSVLSFNSWPWPKYIQ